MKKKVIALSLSAFIIFLIFGVIFAVNSYAIDRSSAYSWIPYTVSVNSLPNSDWLIAGTDRNGINVIYSSNYEHSKACAYQTNGYFVVVCAIDNTDYNSNYTFNMRKGGSGSNFKPNSTYGNLRYNTVSSDTFRIYTCNIPIYSNLNACLDAMDDGVWDDSPPVDPEYQFDINIGGLQNVSWKQVAVPSTNETLLEVSYDQYTTTGVNMMNSGMGVAIRYQAYNSIDSVNPFWKSEAYFADVYDVIDVTMQWLIGPDAINANRNIGSIEVEPFSGGGGGHSFSSPDDFSGGGGGHDIVVNNEVYYIDLILTPYYFDGTDYYYGYNTSINKVYFDYVGTRLIPTENEFQNTDTYLNNGSTNTYYYDYGISADYIDNSTNFYYYTTNNVFNYTGVTDDPTEVTFNDIDNSTENVYNFTGIGSIPDLDIDGFNISPAQIINNLKGVIVALVVASPILMGLFDFLPYWAINIAVACCITVAVICVVRIFRIGGGGTS